MRRLHPSGLGAFDADGLEAVDGVHALQVADGITLGLTPAIAPIDSSVQVILLPAGSDAGDVPVGTPVGTIVLVKA